MSHNKYVHAVSRSIWIICEDCCFELSTCLNGIFKFQESLPYLFSVKKINILQELSFLFIIVGYGGLVNKIFQFVEESGEFDRGCSGKSEDWFRSESGSVKEDGRLIGSQSSDKSGERLLCLWAWGRSSVNNSLSFQCELNVWGLDQDVNRNLLWFVHLVKGTMFFCNGNPSWQAPNDESSSVVFNMQCTKQNKTKNKRSVVDSQ